MCRIEELKLNASFALQMPYLLTNSVHHFCRLITVTAIYTSIHVLYYRFECYVHLRVTQHVKRVAC